MLGARPGSTRAGPSHLSPASGNSRSSCRSLSRAWSVPAATLLTGPPSGFEEIEQALPTVSPRRASLELDEIALSFEAEDAFRCRANRSRSFRTDDALQDRATGFDDLRDGSPPALPWYLSPILIAPLSTGWSDFEQSEYPAPSISSAESKTSGTRSRRIASRPRARRSSGIVLRARGAPPRALRGRHRLLGGPFAGAAWVT